MVVIIFALVFINIVSSSFSLAFHVFRGHQYDSWSSYSIRPVGLLGRSQSSTFNISLARVFPSCFPSSSPPFPRFRGTRPRHFPHVFVSPRHTPFWKHIHSRYPSNAFVPDLVVACHSTHPHRVHVDPFLVVLYPTFLPVTASVVT